MLILSIAVEDEGVPALAEQTTRLEALRSFKRSAAEEEELTNLLNELSALFARRPVWLKQGIERELALLKVGYSSDFTLKKALAASSYLFRNGPWKFTYVRFGYDPRLNKEALEYQTFNVGYGNKNFMNQRRDQDK